MSVRDFEDLEWTLKFGQLIIVSKRTVVSGTVGDKMRNSDTQTDKTVQYIHLGTSKK